MTRKDYVLLAKALYAARVLEDLPIAQRQHAMDCEYVADALAQDNPRFDRALFLKNAGVQS